MTISRGISVQRTSAMSDARAEHDDPPIGESGVELHGAAAADAISKAIEHRQALPKVRISPRGLDAYRDGPWVVIVFRFKGQQYWTLKLTKFWAQLLKAKLEDILTCAGEPETKGATGYRTDRRESHS